MPTHSPPPSGSDNVAYSNSGLLCAIDNYPIQRRAELRPERRER